MKNARELENEIRMNILGLYYSSWCKALDDDMKERRLYVTPIKGQYGKGAGYMFVIEGTPPRGMLYYFPDYNEIFFRKGTTWRDLTIAKKYEDFRTTLAQWKKLENLS